MNRQAGFTLAELLIAIVGIGAITLLFVALYVVAHFLMKFW